MKCSQGQFQQPFNVQTFSFPIMKLNTHFYSNENSHHPFQFYW